MRRAGRRTNLALLGALAVAFASGVGAFTIGTGSGRWMLWLHGVSGLGVLLLAPWKTGIARRGLGRRRPGSWASLILAVFVVVAVAAGVGHASGVLVTLGPLSAMQVHVVAAVAALPLAAWHVIVRPIRPRVTDLSRRTLLRAGLYVGASGAAYAGAEAIVRGFGLPGSDRRFTGSFERGSFDPARMPVTQWLNDRVPEAPASSLTIVPLTGSVEDSGERRIDYDRLASFDRELTTTLDCTGGWYAAQHWEGAWLADLVRPTGDERSVVVRSLSGYQRRLPVAELDRLMLATRVGGHALSAGHGFPFRLVAPRRRGFWWVKWVDRIELSDAPSWWQPPFPVA